MIQRIQSVYLCLGAIAIASPLYLRSWIVDSAAGSPLVDTGVQVLAALTALCALVAIFLYDNRERQYKIVLGVQVLTLVLILSVLSTLYLRGNFPGAADNPVSASSLALVLSPFVAYGLFFLARRAVRRDIKLVKSMDRLR